MHSHPAVTLGIAGRRLEARLPPGVLDLLHAPASSNPRLPRAPSSAEGPEVRTAAGWAAGAWHRLRLSRDGPDLRLEVEGVAEFTLSGDGLALALARLDGELPPPRLAALAAGPPLVLALALQNVFCLHAAAVADPGGRAVALVGPSGSGKSTLAAGLASISGWLPVADDTLAVEGRPGHEGEVHTRFPHLPSAGGLRPPGGLPETLPLGGLMQLQRPLSAGAAPSLSELDAGAGALVILRHTVGARLFPTELRRRHLDWCARLAAACPPRALAYPWAPGAAPAVARRLLSTLADAPRGE